MIVIVNRNTRRDYMRHDLSNGFTITVTDDGGEERAVLRRDGVPLWEGPVQRIREALAVEDERRGRIGT